MIRWVIARSQSCLCQCLKYHTARSLLSKLSDHFMHVVTFAVFHFLEMMLHVDQTKRADINQVAGFAFNMIGKPCPVRSLQVSFPKFTHIEMF